MSSAFVNQGYNVSAYVYEAFASNPRYNEGGLEAAIEEEELAKAREIDREAAATEKFEEMLPKPIEEMTGAEAAAQIPDDSEPAPEMTQHQKWQQGQSDYPSGPDKYDQYAESFNNAIEELARVPINTAAGLNKAINNSVAGVVGRETYEKAVAWTNDNIPGLKAINELAGRGFEARHTGDEVSQMAVQILGPFKAGLETSAALGMGKFGQALTADAFTGYFALDPHMDRLAGLFKQAGMEHKFIGWMAENVDETEVEGRLKNLIETLGLSGVVAGGIEVMAKTVKGLYWAKEAATNRPSKELLTESRPAHEVVEKGITGPAPAPSKTAAVGTPVRINEIPAAEREHVISDFMSGQKGYDIDEALKRAEAAQTELGGILDEIDVEMGVFHANPGVKKLESASKKLAEGSTDASHIKDLARSGYTMQDISAADALVEKLSKRLPVMDEGFSVTPAGYFDRKVLVRTSNGQVAEVQIWDEVMLSAKGEGGGHKTYKRWQETYHRTGPMKGQPIKGREKEYEQLQREQIDLYLGKAKEMPAAARKIYVENAQKLRGTMEYLGYSLDELDSIALNSPSSSIRPRSNTSPVSAGSNAPPTNDMATTNLAPPSSLPTSTEGLPSKSAKPTTLSGSSIDKSPIIPTDESIANTKKIVKNFEPLESNLAKYFTNPKKTKTLDISKLVPQRQREKGVRNAYKYMKQAAEGKGAKREPIKVKENKDGTYTIVDGNSTYAIAVASEWKKIPAQVVKAAPAKKPSRAKLDLSMEVDEAVDVGGEIKKIKRKAGDVLKDLDTRIDSFDKALEEIHAP